MCSSDLYLLHGFHEQDFYYRSIDFFFMYIRVFLLVTSIIKCHVYEVSRLEKMLQDPCHEIVKKWLMYDAQSYTHNTGLQVLHVGL